MREDLAAAERAYRGAIEVDPTFAEALNNLGALLRDTDRGEEGIAMLRRAVEARPGLASAHLVGVSMGGMIVQTMAILNPERVRSLTSIMSTTGRRSVGWQHPSLLPGLLSRQGEGRAAYVRTSAAFWRLIGSPDYPRPEEEVEAQAAETFDRGISRGGVLRQMLAVLTQPNRASRLHGLTMPALVVHGLADKMVHASGGRATAAAIPGAELLLIPGMGHDMPRQLWPTFLDAIERTAHRART